MKCNHAVAGCALILILVGCGGGEHEDVRQWMAESSRDLRGNVPPLPELKPFPITAYNAANKPDPFSAARVEPEKGEDGGKKPDLDRPKEQLESFSIESLSYVGLLKHQKNGSRRALILADRVMYQVGIGHYLGENFGRIIEIDDAEIKLIETVRDPSGQTRDWVERAVSLRLVEGGSGKGGGK